MNVEKKLIIAPPFLTSNWGKTVTIILEHTKTDAVGVVVNCPSNTTIREFGKQCGFNLNVDGVIYAGGPDDVNLLTMIHSPDWSCNNTMVINESMSISSSREVLEQLEKKNCPKKWRLCIGLTEWKNRQLDMELNGIRPFTKEESWLVASATNHIVFGKDPDKQWLSAIEQTSKEFTSALL